MSDGYFSMLNMPDAKERRRYALLNAASVIYAEGMKAVNMSTDLCPMVVSVAEALLIEIERREEAK